MLDHGYQPMSSDDPSEAVQLAEEYQPQLCVIGLDQSACGTAAQLAQALRPSAGTIIINEEDQHPRPECNVSGSLHYLKSPFSMLEFIASVDEAL